MTRQSTTTQTLPTEHECTTKCSYPGPRCPGHAPAEDPHAAAQEALRATPDADLLTKAYALTHRIHEATSSHGERMTHRSEGARLAEHRQVDDLRAQRDLITAEVLRRMGGQA